MNIASKISCLILIIILSSCCAVKEKIGIKLWRINKQNINCSCIIRDGEGKRSAAINKDRITCKCSKISMSNDLAYEIRDILNNRNDSFFHAWAICPTLVSKKEKFGLYQYWLLSTHTDADNFFIFDRSHKIIFIDKENYEANTERHLKSLSFKEKDILKAINKMKKAHIRY